MITPPKQAPNSTPHTPTAGIPPRPPSRCPMPADPYTVRATHSEADDSNRVGLVQILPADS